jgi:hypothetical protein
MERENHKEQETATLSKLGRGWTQRFSGPIVYRRFSDIDAGGRPYIFFKFELPPGENNLPQPVKDILNDLKHLKRDPAGGHSGPSPTGLTYTRDRFHGRVWKVADNEIGRTAADVIDARLTDLAEKLETEPAKGR